MQLTMQKVVKVHTTRDSAAPWRGSSDDCLKPEASPLERDIDIQRQCAKCHLEQDQSGKNSKVLLVLYFEVD